MPEVAAGSRSARRSFAADGALELDAIGPCTWRRPFGSRRSRSRSPPRSVPAWLRFDERAAQRCSRTPPATGPVCVAAARGVRRALVVLERRLLGGRRAVFADYSEAMRDVRARAARPDGDRVREPPRRGARHVAGGRVGTSPVASIAYPEARRPTGGLWSTVGDLAPLRLRTISQPLRRSCTSRRSRRSARSTRSAGGCASRTASRSTTRARSRGYQSLLLLVPERELVLAVLTNRWRGSALIRRVVEPLGPRCRTRACSSVARRRIDRRRTRLDDVEAVRSRRRPASRSARPIRSSGTTIRALRYPFGGGSRIAGGADGPPD